MTTTTTPSCLPAAIYAKPGTGVSSQFLAVGTIGDRGWSPDTLGLVGFDAVHAA